VLFGNDQWNLQIKRPHRQPIIPVTLQVLVLRATYVTEGVFTPIILVTLRVLVLCAAYITEGVFTPIIPITLRVLLLRTAYVTEGGIYSHNPRNTLSTGSD
jgi:hypothetical protein